MFPLRLLVTFVHELGHGMSAMLTGGTFVSFRVFGDGSGVAYTIGGSRIIILSMGYLGAALFGAILLYAANRVARVNTVASALGVFFIVCGVIFGARGVNDIQGLGGAMLAAVIGFVSGLALIALGRVNRPSLTIFILNVLAFVIGFNAVNDIQALLQMQDVMLLGNIPNDAVALGRYTNISPTFWAMLWLALALAMMGAAAYGAFIQRRER
jgi:hypothetical protein